MAEHNPDGVIATLHNSAEPTQMNLETSTASANGSSRRGKDAKLGLTGVERHFDEDEIIVSKTDPRGRMTYVNDVFLEVSGYTEDELIGQPHSMIRHPEMPRCIFKLLWDTIAGGQELFAYVNNRAKNGDNYWVFAHVTPTFDAAGAIVGYHSSRRCPKREQIAQIAPLYAALLAEEQRHDDRKIGMQSAYQRLLDTLAKKGIGYDEFVFSL